MPETPLYQEMQRSRIIEWTAVVAVIATAIVCGVLIPGRWGWLIGIAAGAAEYVLLRLFSRLHIVITPTRVVFGFSIMKRRFDVAGVTVGAIEKIPFMAGVGVHFFGGRWVYNARMGRGVSLTAHGTGYLVGSDSPEQFHSALMLVSKGKAGA